MNFLSRLSLKTTLIIFSLSISLIPLSVVAVFAWTSANKSTEDMAESYYSLASNLADKIDRNLFERYGDVQAFGLNHAVRDKADWYKKGEENPIVQAMNNYVDTYDIYYLTLLVDLDGKLIAVNTRDDSRNPIDTQALYTRNFSSEPWFNDCLAGKFYESADGSFTGTVMEDLYVDEAVQKIYGDEGLALGYSAPVHDANGEVIAVWKNVTKFGLVEDIVLSTYMDLKSRGLTSAEITLLDKHGNVIVDCDPTTLGRDEIARDMSIIGKFNLAEKGVEAARRVVDGEPGSIVKSYHARKQIYQVAGFTPFKGALGFPGMEWNALVRVSRSEALATANTTKNACIIIFAVATVLIVIASWFFARWLIKALLEVDNVARSLAGVSEELAAAAEELSSGAQQQASSLEETAASLEEITGTVQQNADNAQQANQLSSGARDVAEKGGQVTQRAISGMSEINSSSNKIAAIITTIDEIAFQTNLLALNAAVEAARAGEQGRGFAVVAGEVRNLAQRSAGAAKEIKTLIQDSVDKVESGSELVNQSGKTLDEIVTSVKRVTDIVGEIAAASREQSTGIEQVNRAITQMDHVTQSTASQTEQLSSTAESLAGQARYLRDVVSQFNLNNAMDRDTATVDQRPAKSASAPRSTRGNANQASKPIEDFGFHAPEQRDLQPVGASDDEFGAFEEF